MAQRGTGSIPNRIFVGGLAPETTEDELRTIFQVYGNVTATKIIIDRAGTSKGYGFVTFTTAEEADNALKGAQGVVIHDRKLNVAEAYRKGNSSGADSPRAVVFPNYTNPLVGRESVCFPGGQVPYMPAYYLHYPQSPGGYFPYLYALSPDQFDQQSETQSDIGKPYPKQSSPSNSDYESRVTKSFSPGHNALRYNNSNPLQHPLPLHQFVPKSLGGMAVLAYPSPLMVGPPIFHLKENSNENESLISELSYLHSPISTNTLTPPPTPLAPIPCDFGASPSLENIRKN